MATTLKAQKKTKIVSGVRKKRKIVRAVRVEPLLEVDSTFDLDTTTVDPKPGDYILSIPKGYKRVRIGAMYTKWLSALRSSRYKQGSDFLAVRSKTNGTSKAETRYCCLGVLSKLQNRLHFVKEEQDLSGGPLYFSDCTAPSSSVSAHSVLNHDNPLGYKIGLGGEFYKFSASPIRIHYCDRELLKLYKPKNKGVAHKSLYFTSFTSLTEANDGGMTFKQIAWVIGRLFRV